MSIKNIINNLLWGLFYIMFTAFAFIFNKTGTWVSLYFLTILFIINIISIFQSPKHLQLKRQEILFQPIENESNKLILQFFSDKKILIPHCTVKLFLQQQELVSQPVSCLFEKELNFQFEDMNFQRGIYPEVHLIFNSSDFFSIFKRSYHYTIPTHLTILPKRVGEQAQKVQTFLAHHQHELAFASEETNYDLKKIRPYLPGDRVNQIDWKLTSKRQELIFKEYEHDKREYPVFAFLGEAHHDIELILSLYYTFIRQYFDQFSDTYYLYEDHSLLLNPSDKQFAGLFIDCPLEEQLVFLLENIDISKTIILFTSYPNDLVVNLVRSAARKRPIILIYAKGKNLEVITSTRQETQTIL